MPTRFFRQAIARAVRPPQRVTVSEAAARHRRLNNPGSYVGPWQNDKVPYLVEPMDAMTSRDVSEVTVVAPAQSGKTEILLNVIGHGAKYRAADMLLLQPTRDLANDFGHRRLQIKTLDCSPDLAIEVGSDRSDDKVLTKVFRNGMICTIAWAVAGQLASRPVPIVMIDERDRMPNDINGEGSPKQLARQRTKTFGRNAKILEVSSPSKTDGTGIIASYREGDQRLWFWPCPDCGEYWAAGFDDDRQPTMAHLSVPAGVTPDQVIELARLTCPHCGVLIDESRKAGMNARGVWVPIGMTIDRDGELSGEPPEGRHRSYWWHGFNNPIVPVGELAALWLKAEKHYEQTGDEEPLRTFYNADLGVPYKTRFGGERPVEEGELAARCEQYLLGTVPDEVRCLIAAVDIQGRAFDVMVEGYNETQESWLIDRYDIRQLADGRTDVEPGQYPEHWQLLIDRVVKATYPRASDPQRRLPIALTLVDSGGIDGVTDNARAFWRRAKVQGLGKRVMLIKGAATFNAPMLRPPSREELDAKGKWAKTGAPIYILGVHALKNMLDNRLRRQDPGPGCKHFPANPPKGFFAELTAEERDSKGRWQRKRSRANESWDLAVYGAAAALKLRLDRINWLQPPIWASDVATSEEQTAIPEPATPSRDRFDPTPLPAKRRGGFMRRIGGW